MLFDQYADEPLQAAHDGTVQHDGAMAHPVVTHEFSIQALGQVGIDLDGAALPRPPNRIF